MPGINPALLRWARETAALSLDEAAKEDPAGPGARRPGRGTAGGDRGGRR